MWNFKGTLWNSTQNILPIHWKIWFLYNIEILWALRFKSSYAFLKRPPGLPNSQMCLIIYAVRINSRCYLILFVTMDIMQNRCFTISFSANSVKCSFIWICSTIWNTRLCLPSYHYSDIIMNVMASQITSLTIVCSTVCSGAHQRKHQSSVSLAFVRGIHPWPVNSPHKGPVTRKMFPFDDVIM